MRDDIRTPNVLKEIGKLRGAGMSYKGIGRAIKEQFNLKTIPNDISIKKVYEVYAARQGEVIMGDQELKNEIKSAVLDSTDQLKKLNVLVWDLINSAEKSEDKLAASKEILNQLKFQESLLNKITEGFDFKKMNKIEITQIVVNNLEQLQKDGFIKILNNPQDGIIDLENFKERK